MAPRSGILAVAALFAAVSTSGPAHLHAQQPSQDHQHEQQQPAPAAGDQHAMMPMMATMHASTQKLDDLVKKMNAATGSAKVDAIAELLTALVEDRRTMHESMMPMMNMMHAEMMGAHKQPLK